MHLQKHNPRYPICINHIFKYPKIMICACLHIYFQGAQVIVFPEYGVYGLGWSRKTIVPYLEYIPDPQLQLRNPCLNPVVHNNTDVQHSLSCLARNSHIYVIANIGAIQPCNKTDLKCPDDGHYQYSANVVYDSNGSFVARYFKQNLFSYEVPYFDKPSKVDYTVFNTSFGLFGTFTSHDIMFHEPVITLIEKMKIENIVYPAAWKDELPLMAAIEFHSAFSMGMGINFLVANLHRPSDGYHGSGMYWPMGTSNDGVYYYNDSLNSLGQLLVHEVGTSSDVKINSMSYEPSGYRPIFNKETKPYSTKFQAADTFKAVVNHDLYTLVPIHSSYGDLQVCQGTVCCSTSFEGMDFENTTYALGAFDGIHTRDGSYYLQACIFIQCANDSLASCGEPTKTSTSYMDKMSFSGNFTTKYVFPEVLVTYDHSLEIVTRTWLYQESIIIDVGVPGGPLSISLYARDYSRDPS